MDILFSLLLAAIAYLVPKLGEQIWKEYQSRIANYGNSQGQRNKGEPFVQNSATSTYVPSVMQVEVEAEIEPASVVVQASEHSAALAPLTPPPAEGTALWAGKMDGNAVIEGVVFAEIVQPPRAYRPFIRRK